MASTTLNLTPDVYRYYQAQHGREHPVLTELREETAKLGPDANMQIAPEQGAFMALMVKLTGAKRILEFGCFTGYSSTAMALAGEALIDTADVSESFTAVARRAWEKAGVANRITLHLDGGAAMVERLAAAGQTGQFDLAFIDADKKGYDVYYEGALRLLRKGGLLMVDNVLWGGDVADPSKTDADTEAIRSLNAKIAGDHRVDMCMVPIGDGVTLARKT